MTTSKIHIGQLIQQQLKAQGRTVTWFARQLNYDRSNAYKIFSKPHIDTDLLLTISKVLNYDFFKYIPNNLKEMTKSNVDKLATEVLTRRQQ